MCYWAFYEFCKMLKVLLGLGGRALLFISLNYNVTSVRGFFDNMRTCLQKKMFLLFHDVIEVIILAVKTTL